jgi:protein-tyrosine-phosphatase
MPSFTPYGRYQLTSVQVDLILHCMSEHKGLTTQEDNERRKIIEELNNSSTDTDISDPYLDHYYTCDY